MPSPTHGSQRGRRPSGRTSGRRGSGKLRKGPSGRTGSGSRKLEKEEEELQEPKKNWAPHIIGGCIGGIIFLIIILAWISNPPPDNGDNTGGSTSIGIDEKEIERRAKELTTEAERLVSIYFRTRTAADRQRALDTIDKAIDQWEILRKRHPDWTRIDYDISELNKFRVDIHKMPPLE